MKFTKMQGIGNDYVYVDCTKTPVSNPEGIARLVSDRHFGIGSDGLVLIKSSSRADFMMDMYNSDGSQAKMCGNAIRCVGKFVYDNKLISDTTVTIDTLSGIKTLNLFTENGKVASVRVDMGAPILTPADIPVLLDGKSVINYKITIGAKDYAITCVSTGNPHCVVFVDDVDILDLKTLGQKFEHHPLFPDRINTEFVQVLDRENLRMRVWERGAGETMACGTGACASLVAAVLNGYADRTANLILKGGTLEIEWDELSDTLFMMGPAETVFEGTIDVDNLA